MSTLAELRSDVRTLWVPQADDVSVDAAINEEYLSLADELPLNPSTVTFPTALDKMSYDLSPGGDGDNVTESILRVKRVEYDSDDQKLPLSVTTFPIFNRENDRWTSTASSQPRYFIKYSKDTYWLWPAPNVVKNVRLWVDFDVTELGASDEPVGIPASMQRVLVYGAVLLIAKGFDREDVLPTVAAFYERVKARLERWYQDMLQQTEHIVPIPNYR